VKVSDTATLWEAVTHGAHAVHPTVSSSGRLGYEYYDKLGYVPYNVGINESAARTLEYAYDDWCIYQLGKFLGKSDKELGTLPKKAALNYRNLYDKDSKLMRRSQRGWHLPDTLLPAQIGATPSPRVTLGTTLGPYSTILKGLAKPDGWQGGDDRHARLSV